MATTNTLKPNGTAPASDQGYVVTGAGATLVTAVNDASDSTFVRKPATADSYSIYWNLETVASINETTNIPWRIRVLAREAQGSSGSVALYVKRKWTAGGEWVLWGEYTKRAVSVTGTVSTSGTASPFPPTASITSGYVYLAPFFYLTGGNAAPGEAGLTYKQQIIDELQVGFVDSSTSASRATLYAIWCELQTTTQPTTTITGIDGDTSSPYSVTTTTRPLIEWSYSQTDSITQSVFEVSVFSASAADPTSSTNRLWTSGQVTSSGARSVRPAYDFLNGTTIYVYVRTGFKLGGTTYWSTWANISASVSLTPPGVPSCSASPQSAQRVNVVVSGSAYASGTQTINVQRSTDGGTTWADLYGAENIATSGSYNTTRRDQYALRDGTTMQYRARAIGVVGGQTITSAYSSAATATITSDRKHWLKVLGDYTTDTQVDIIADPSFEIEEQTTVLRPLGRTDPVVVSGVIGGDDGAFELRVSAASWSAVKTLLTYQGTLIWQDPYNTQKFIRITRRSWQRLGDKDSPRYVAQVQFVEVGSP